MGENNSKTEKNTSKNDQLMYKKANCGEGRRQHKSNYNVVSNFVDNPLQENRRKEKQEQNKIIRDKGKQPDKNVQEEFSRQGYQVLKLPAYTKNGDGMTEQTGTMKRRSDILRNRKNIEKQLITNLANVEMAKLKIIYHKNKSLQKRADEDSNAKFCKDNRNSFDVLIGNGETSYNSTQVPVINQRNIYGQPPPPYSPPSVPVFDHQSITNAMPHFSASNLPTSEMYPNEIRSKKAEGRQGNVFSNRKECKHKSDGQQTRNKRKIGIMRGS